MDFLLVDELYQSKRREYESKPLNKEDLAECPFTFFKTWLGEAYQSSHTEPNAFSLATLKAKQPRNRMVLLKAFLDKNLVFFTNYQSHKALEIEACPNVSALFYWPELNRELRIEGSVEKLSEDLSKKYFATRPAASKKGAVVSKQSSVLASRKELEDKFDKMSEDPECPDFWGGYVIRPNYYEFWQGRRDRLHDRFVYQASGDTWEVKRLSP